MDGLKIQTMAIGERKLGAATCRIVQCDALPAHMRLRSREVTALLTRPDKRHQGYGTSLMHKVCREADAAKFVLVLFPLPYDDGPLDRDALVAWYNENFGFAIIQAEPILMARMPVQKMQPVNGLQLVKAPR